MTENFHTPIHVAPAKPPADSETFNAPLSELDAAITDHENRIGTLEGEFDPKSNNPIEFVNGQGNWVVPAGTGASIDGHVIKDEGVSLPQRASIDFVGAGVTVTNEAGGTQVAIPGANGVESVVAGSNVTVDNTNPENPVISASAVQSVVAGTGISVDNTDPENPVISASAVQSVVAGTGISVDNTDPENPVVSALVGGGGVGKNVLLNGGMRIVHRGAGPFTSTTFFKNDDDKYLIDGCILLSDGNDIVDVSQVADNDFVSGYKIRLDVETANKRFGILFPVENKDMQDIRKSGLASLQFKVKCTGSSMANVRALLLSWDNTADAITSDAISAWGSAGSDPIFVANWTKENNGTNLSISTIIATHEIENILVDTPGAVNLAVLIMVDDIDAQVGDYLEIGDVKLESGATCTDYINEHYEVEVANCERLCYTPTIESAWLRYGIGQATTSTNAFIIFYLPIAMRVAPSMIFGAAGNFYVFETGSIVCTALSVFSQDNRILYMQATVSSGLTAGRAVSLHGPDALTTDKLLFSAEL